MTVKQQPGGEFAGAAVETAGSASKSVRARCGAPTIRGGVCTAPGTFPDHRCPHHTTTVSEKTRRGWRQRGLAAQQRAKMPTTFTAADFSTEEGARKILEETTNLVRQGKMPTSVANVVSKLAGTALKLAELKLVKRLGDLERQLAERGGKPR